MNGGAWWGKNAGAFGFSKAIDRTVCSWKMSAATAMVYACDGEEWMVYNLMLDREKLGGWNGVFICITNKLLLTLQNSHYLLLKKENKRKIIEVLWSCGSSRTVEVRDAS